MKQKISNLIQTPTEPEKCWANFGLKIPFIINDKKDIFKTENKIGFPEQYTELEVTHHEISLQIFTIWVL
jgi:hypothetical protein